MDNQNKNLQFKTNINCSGCIKAVTPFINEATHVEQWEVNTTGANKILTVSGKNVEPATVINAVKKAGFYIEPLEQ